MRLEAFRYLVRCAPDGVAAGVLAKELGVPASALSFHLKELSYASILRSERQGRSILYSIRLNKVNKLMQFLYEDCCQGRPELCQPEAECCTNIK